MVQIIAGKKGTGKTKRLIDITGEAVNVTKGDVVFVEPGSKLMYGISNKARLIDSKRFNISGFDALYGFLSGICAANNDVTDIFVDGTLKIGGDNFDSLSAFISKLKVMSDQTDTRIVLSVSADPSELSGIDADIINF